MTIDYFIDHAVKNVWCSPEQDLQLILQLAPIVGKNGRLRNHKVMWRDQLLPDSTNTWFVYQIGGVNPTILGLLPKQYKWVSFADACNANNLIVDIYTVLGVNFPRFETYYMYTADRDLIVAVRENNRIKADLNVDKVYLRLYTNAFFQSNRANSSTDYVKVVGKTVLSNQEFLDLQTLYQTYKTKPGLVYCFIDGFKAKDIDLINAEVNALVEFVYDSSIVKTVDFKINDLNVFDSTLDSKRKYLLHYSGADNQTIDFNDDVDVFVIDKSVTNKERGVYYHRNSKDAVRNVTHRDYSVCVSYVDEYHPLLAEQALPSVVNPQDLYIRLHIRKSGYLRPLIFENNRIKELYKLADTDIIKAFFNLDGTINVWRVDVLESAMYTKIMRSKFTEITNVMVQNAYGYNGLSIVCGNTPSLVYVNSNQKVADVPYALQNKCTAYEYNTDRKLIGTHHIHNNGSVYPAVSQLSNLVEFISGQGTDQPSDTFGTNNVPVPTSYNYRVYYCNNLPSGPDEKWQDVTGTNKYSVENNKVVWHDPLIDPLILVRSDEKFLAYGQSLTAGPVNDIFTFNITTKQDRGDGVKSYTSKIPYGDLVIFVNGYSLIRGLDYQIKNGVVYLNSIRCLNNPTTTAQDVQVRFTGFCNPDLTLSESVDYGFIEHGFLSNNNRFDIRDDKVLRITVDGRLYTKADVQFSEDHAGVGILDTDNGKPYQIKDIVVPLRGLVGENTYSLRSKSIVIDKLVSDYLSLKLPQPTRPAPSAIIAKYQLFSPFMHKVIKSLINNSITVSDLPNQYSDTVVMQRCKQLEYLLEFDHGSKVGPSFDSRYVIVLPTFVSTVIDVSLPQYRFLEKVIRIYTPKVVGLSPYLRIV